MLLQELMKINYYNFYCNFFFLTYINNRLKKKMSQYQQAQQVPADFIDPINLNIMNDPVMYVDKYGNLNPNQIMDRKTVNQILKMKEKGTGSQRTPKTARRWQDYIYNDPRTGKPTLNVRRNHQLRQKIKQWLKKNPNHPEAMQLRKSHLNIKFSDLNNKEKMFLFYLFPIFLVLFFNIIYDIYNYTLMMYYVSTGEMEEKKARLTVKKTRFIANILNLVANVIIVSVITSFILYFSNFDKFISAIKYLSIAIVLSILYLLWCMYQPAISYESEVLPDTNRVDYLYTDKQVQKKFRKTVIKSLAYAGAMFVIVQKFLFYRLFPGEEYVKNLLNEFLFNIGLGN